LLGTGNTSHNIRCTCYIIRRMPSMLLLVSLFIPRLRDGPHCRTWNPGGEAGSRSNSSHFTYPLNLHSLIPKSTHPHPLDLDPTPPTLHLVFCSEELLEVTAVQADSPDPGNLQIRWWICTYRNDYISALKCQ